MATAETFHPQSLRLPSLKGGVEYVRQSTEKLLSFRDQSRAADMVAQTLASVGPLEYLDTEIVPATEEVPEVRTRHTATVRHNRTGHTHQLLITEPLSQNIDTSGIMITLPGITQNPSRGNANLAHRAFADAHPDMRVASIHTDGIGDHDKLWFWQALHRPFEGMAASRLDIIKGLAGDTPVHLNGFSMATALVVKMAIRNEESGAINLASKTLISPAIVTPDRAKYVMGYEFLPHAYKTELEQAAVRRFGRLAVIYSAATGMPLPCVGNAVELGHGTEKSAFLQASGGSPMAIIHGSEDPLAQPALYAEAALVNPGNVHVLEKQGRGHSVSKPEYAREIAEDIRRFTSQGSLSVSQELSSAA